MDPVSATHSPVAPGSTIPFVSDSMNAAQVAFGFVGVNTKDESDLNVFQLNLAGDSAIELPGGVVGWAVGYENRRESAASKPDGGAAIGAIAFTPGNVTSGKYQVDEFYGEVIIPILAGEPLAEVLTVEASARYTDVDFLDDSDTVFKVAAEWAPDRGHSLSVPPSPKGSARRASASCSSVSSSPPSPIPIPAATTAPPVRTQTPSPTVRPTVWTPTSTSRHSRPRPLQGGNPSLEPETSQSFTLGAVYTPEFLDGLVLTLDYFDVEIEDAIGTAPTSEVISSCYASAGFSDPLCAFIVGLLPGRRRNATPECARTS